MQKQAAKLKYIEGVSKAVFSENRELICNIQELQDQEESGAKASVRDFEVLGTEMSRVKEALESMMHKLEEIDERVSALPRREADYQHQRTLERCTYVKKNTQITWRRNFSPI